MKVEFKELTTNDGMDIYEMLQEIPADENGLLNGGSGLTFEEYKQWLIKKVQCAKGIALEKDWVPENYYWMYCDGLPVGFGKLRHSLTEKLLVEGGHVGYAIRPSCRSKGYGHILLSHIKNEANSLHIEKILLTVNNDNGPSIGLALANGGIVEKVSDERHYIWIQTST